LIHKAIKRNKACESCFFLREIRIFCSVADANWGLNQHQMATNAYKQLTDHIIRGEMWLISHILAGEDDLYYELTAP